jgi:hypothetical protein
MGELLPQPATATASDSADAARNNAKGATPLSFEERRRRILG